jgi:hypothetical protein
VKKINRNPGEALQSGLRTQKRSEKAERAQIRGAYDPKITDEKLAMAFFDEDTSKIIAFAITDVGIILPEEIRNSFINQVKV